MATDDHDFNEINSIHLDDEMYLGRTTTCNTLGTVLGFPAMSLSAASRPRSVCRVWPLRQTTLVVQRVLVGNKRFRPVSNDGWQWWPRNLAEAIGIPGKTPKYALFEMSVQLVHFRELPASL